MHVATETIQAKTMVNNVLKDRLDRGNNYHTL